MQKVLTCAQMRAADEYTIRTLGVPSQELMERAGAALAEETEKLLAACGGNAKTSGNVYYTRNGGGSWEVFAPGLPQPFRV